MPVLAVLFLLSSALVTLVATEPGTRLLFRLVQVLHPSLSIQKIDGTLANALWLEGVCYQDPEWRLSASAALLAWRPRALGQGRLHIRRLELTDLIFEAKGKSTTQEPITLPEIRLPLPVVIEDLIIHRLSIRSPDSEAVEIDRIDLSLTATDHRLQLQRARVERESFAFHAYGQLQLQAHYPLSLRFDWRYRPDFRGQGEIGGDLQHLSLNHSVTAPFTVTTSGTLSKILTHPGFDLQGQWREIRWPLKDSPRWLAPQGRYHLHGTPADYRLSLAAVLSGERLPATRLQLQGRGNLQGFNRVTVRAEGEAGVLTGSGRLHWDPALAWRLTLAGEHLNPAWWQAEFPGDLHLSARCQGQLAPDLEVHLDLERLQGRLRGQLVEAKGRLSYRDQRLQSDRFDLSWGNNRLQLHGTAGFKRLDLGFRLHAPRLDVVAPGLAGALQGQGRISGPPAQPEVKLSLSGHQLRWGDQVSLKRLSLQARGDPQDPNSRLRLRLHHLQGRSWQFDQVQADAWGRLADHRLQLKAQGPLGSIHLDAKGSYRPGKIASWEGQISRLPLTLLQPLLPEDTSVTGLLKAHFSYRQGSGERRGWLQCQLPQAAFAARSAAGQRVTLTVADGQGRVVLENRRLEAELSLPFSSQGSIEARLTTDLASQQLGGQARMDFTRLRGVEVLVPQLQEVNGSLHGELQLAGTWRHPVVGIDLRLTDASARILPAGIRVQQVNLKISGETAKTLAVSGGGRSGPGQVAMQGEVRLQPGLSLHLHLHGDHFEVASLPQARVLISPDLTVEADRQAVRLSGNVHLPEANIRLRQTLLPQQTPEMVAVSRDEIIVGRPPKSRQRRLKILSRIELTLGEKVHFQGYGLEAGLKGELSLTTEDSLTTAEGVIQLLDGRFITYGQKLEITSGRILFNGPVNNPAFDIQIVRNIKDDNVTVTLWIGGFADDPQLNIESQPPLPEEDAIAYLIAGRPWTKAKGSEGNGTRTAVANALASLGVSYLNKMGLTKLAQVEFESGNLVIGKYLTSDLYIGYGVDVFTGIGGALLRYDLTPRLQVEASSGAKQSVDMFYTLETD